MSSTNKTAHLALNQWVGTDPFRMADFNADNQKIDDAVKANAQAIAANATAISNNSKSIAANATAISNNAKSIQNNTKSIQTNATAIANAANTIAAVQNSALRIATGSYKGNNTNGSGNQNSLTFDFVPKVIVIRRENSGFGPAIFYQGESSAWYGYTSNSGEKLNVTWSSGGKTVLWYNTTGFDQQMNNSQYRYLYFAIG